MYERLANEDLAYKDIFNLSFDIYRSNFKPIVLLTLLIYTPYYLLEYFVLKPDIMIAFWDDFTNYFANMLDAGSYAMELPRSILVVFGLTLAEGMIFVPLAVGGLTAFVISLIKNGSASFEDCLAGSLGKAVKIIPTSIIMNIIVMSGFSLFFIPGIYFSVLYAFCSSAVILTGRWGMGALKESSYASFGKWFKTLGFLALVYAFDSAYTYLAENLVAIMFQFIPYNGLLAAFMSLLISIFSMYLYMVQCIWFINKHNLFIKLRNKHITSKQ